MRARRPSSLQGKRGHLTCKAWKRQTCNCDHGHLEAPACVRGLEPRPVGMQSFERCPARTLLQNDQEVLQGLRATVAKHLVSNRAVWVTANAKLATPQAAGDIHGLQLHMGHVTSNPQVDCPVHDDIGLHIFWLMALQYTFNLEGCEAGCPPHRSEPLPRALCLPPVPAHGGGGGHTKPM